MKVYRYETLLLEPLIGHTGLGGQPSGHRPRAVSVQARADGGTVENPGQIYLLLMNDK
jgi:hypothetical protein